MDQAKLKIVKNALKAIKMHTTEKPPVPTQAQETAKLGSYPPTMHLDVKEAPFLKGYQVGDECMIVIKTKVTSHNAHESSSGSSNDDYGLEVLSIGQISHTPVGKKEEAGY